MIQLGRVLGGVGWVVDIPTTFIQLAGAGSKMDLDEDQNTCKILIYSYPAKCEILVQYPGVFPYV